MYTYIYICIYICIHIYIYVYVYLHDHTCMELIEKHAFNTYSSYLEEHATKLKVLKPLAPSLTPTPWSFDHQI